VIEMAITSKESAMKALQFSVLTLLIITSCLASFADAQESFQPMFPTERLSELRRALDTARGDEAAVSAWLGSDVNLDVTGKVNLIYTIGRKDFQVAIEALTDRAAVQWRDGVWLMREDLTYVLLYRGMSIFNVLYALGIELSVSISWSLEEVKTFKLPLNMTLTAGVDTLKLKSPLGSFTFDRVAGHLQGWSVEGLLLKIAIFVDEQLFLMGLASNLDTDSISLVLDGIPYFNPLFCAIANNRFDLVDSLLKAGANPVPGGSGRTTALHVAAASGQRPLVSFFLDAGLDINGSTEAGITPLIAAADQKEKASAFLQLNPSHDSEEETDMEPLLFRFFLAEEEQDIDIVAAEIRRREETALLLLDRGADPLKRKDSGETALFGAAGQDMLQLMDRLLDSGVDPDTKNENDETAAFAAVRADKPASLQKLIRSGAKWNGKNIEGETPLDIAKQFKLVDCIGILKWRQPFHWSIGSGFHYSSSTNVGYEAAPGAGGFLDLHFHPAHFLWLTAECGYTVRGTYAPPDDPWLVSTFGSPYYNYQHVDFSAMLNIAILRGYFWRLSALVGGDYRLQTFAVIRTDSEAWEPIDVGDQLESSGWGLTFGIGYNGFRFLGGMLVGLELRYSLTMSGDWTGKGGNLDSWVLAARFGL
jgi:ankyrin repeat protein